MSHDAKEPRFLLGANRVEALCDGIFAIAMTLLILEIKVPVLHGDVDVSAKLPGAFLALWPKFMCYVISFVTLGVYWVAHHLHFMTIRKADRNLLWINILFLMAISLVPFTTAFAGEYMHERLPVILYGANMILIGVVLQLHWWYATSGHRLINPDTPSALIKTVEQVILMGSVAYLAAIGLVFINPVWSMVAYSLVNLLYIVPGGIHLHLKHDKPVSAPPAHGG